MAVSPMIQVHEVTKIYSGRVILDTLNLTVMPGEIWAVIGPSGCGKSTFLRILSGLEEPDAGQVELADDNLSLVFQYSALFDSLTVFENVAFSLIETPDSEAYSSQRQHYTERELRALVEEKLHLVGLGDIQDYYPNELSGGMQKRVSFARAIMSNPKVILYDEPTAGLDPIASTMIENYIVMLRNQIGATSLIVTHNLSTIRRIADKVCLLFDGKIQWQGMAQEFFTTDNPYARQFAQASLDGPMS